jgi:hypothetical protein
LENLKLRVTVVKIVKIVHLSAEDMQCKVLDSSQDKASMDKR